MITLGFSKNKSHLYSLEFEMSSFVIAVAVTIYTTKLLLTLATSIYISIKMYRIYNKINKLN